ncbi:MAG: hypothetical protein LBT39_08695 [Treponema sp.]|nr:hypothetical protein [Treponema sp.]
MTAKKSALAKAIDNGVKNLSRHNQEAKNAAANYGSIMARLEEMERGNILTDRVIQDLERKDEHSRDLLAKEKVRAKAAMERRDEREKLKAEKYRLRWQLIRARAVDRTINRSYVRRTMQPMGKQPGA